MKEEWLLFQILKEACLFCFSSVEGGVASVLISLDQGGVASLSLVQLS